MSATSTGRLRKHPERKIDRLGQVSRWKNAVPESMPMMIGLVSTACSVLANPSNDRLPYRAHSTETVSKGPQDQRKLKAGTKATDGSAASPKRFLGEQQADIKLLENAAQREDRCATPSSEKTFHATPGARCKDDQAAAEEREQEARVDRRQLRKSQSSRNSVAGNATEKTKRVRPYEIKVGQRVTRISA